MKKRRGGVSPTKGHPNISFGNSMAMSKSPSVVKVEEPSKVKIVCEKQPTGRDGHSVTLTGSKLLVFGGDRHHMPFNDTYVLDL